LDESVAICSSVAELTLSPKSHANTVAPSPLTSAAASTAVSNSVLPGAASTVCSPSETSSTIFVAPTRPSSAKSCCAASKPSEIEVLPSADISSIPALISAALYDHGTRVVAFAAKDTTEKRVASTPREYWFTSCLAKAFIPLGPSIEPSGRGFFIEPLSSSTRTKSIGVAQGGLGALGGLGGGGDGETCTGENLKGGHIFHPRTVLLCGVCTLYPLIRSMRCRQDVAGEILPGSLTLDDLGYRAGPPLTISGSGARRQPPPTHSADIAKGRTPGVGLTPTTSYQVQLTDLSCSSVDCVAVRRRTRPQLQTVPARPECGAEAQIYVQYLGVRPCART